MYILSFIKKKKKKFLRKELKNHVFAAFLYKSRIYLFRLNLTKKLKKNKKMKNMKKHL